jgi:hypothetical protein
MLIEIVEGMASYLIRQNCCSSECLTYTGYLPREPLWIRPERHCADALEVVQLAPDYMVEVVEPSYQRHSRVDAPLCHLPGDIRYAQQHEVGLDDD